MSTLRFKQVDVFTDKPFFGNPVAVVIGAEELETAAMQRVAAWTNLSETTFLMKSDKADYRLRIFTPRRELAFAGHPTIGSAHAALESGFVPKKKNLRMECMAGILDIEVEGNQIFVRGPQPKISPVSADFGVKLLSEPLRVDVGVAWVVGEVADTATLAALAPDMALMAKLGGELDASGLAPFALASDGVSAIHVRAFAPRLGVGEDPVTGSANLCIPAYLQHKNQLARVGNRYVARQGMQLGRDGRVSVRVESDGTWIGGSSVTCVEGTLRA